MFMCMSEVRKTEWHRSAHYGGCAVTVHAMTMTMTMAVNVLRVCVCLCAVYEEFILLCLDPDDFFPLSYITHVCEIRPPLKSILLNEQMLHSSFIYCVRYPISL